MSMFDASWRGDAACWSDNHRHAFSRSERQRIFREMVMAEMRNGSLSAMRRVRLVQFAARLGLSSLEAGSLISDARQDLVDARSMAHGRPGMTFVHEQPRESWAAVQWLCALLITAAIPAALWLLSS